MHSIPAVRDYFKKINYKLLFFVRITGSPPFRSDEVNELLRLNRRGNVDFANAKLLKASPEGNN